MSGCPASVIADSLVFFSSLVCSIRLLKPDAIRVIPTRHVGQDNSISLVQPFHYLDRIHRGSSNLYWHAQSPLPIRAQSKQTNRAILLPECWTADIEHVVQPFQIDGSVHTQVRPRPPGQFPTQFDIDRYRSVLYGRIDPHHRARDHAVVSVDRRWLSNLYVARLR